MSEPLRILHVFGHMDRGGAELRTLELVRHIGRRYRFHFCGLSGRAGELDEEIRAAGAEVHLLCRSRIGFAHRFRRLLGQGRFEVIYSHLLHYSGYILWLAAECHVPVRAAFFRSLHDGRRPGPVRSGYRRFMRRWIDRYATHILAVSEGTMAAAWGPHWKADPRCRVIYNGLDLQPFAEAADREAVRRRFGLPADAPWYIHVGHLREPKNHLRLIGIFAELLRRRPSARLLLVGRGGNRIERHLRQRIAQLGIEDHVVHTGQRTDVPRLLMAADALIFPSLWEGLPGAVLEACAAGTPVLASDLPGVREIAARLPQVQYLSLDADDTTWAHLLAALPNGRDADAARQQARRAFAGSVFTIDVCANQHRRIWRGLGARASAVGKPITILHVHGRMARGGAELRSLDLLRHIDRRRYRFHFCALSGLPGELDNEIRALGGEVHRLRQSRIGFPRRFRALLRAGQFDVVHSHLHYYSGCILRLAAECGVRVRVAHFRTSKSDQVLSLGRKVLHGLMRQWIDRYASDAVMRRWIDRYATDILGVSRWALRSTWGPDWRSDPRCQVVYDGLDATLYDDQPDGQGIRREFGLPDEAPLFVHVGRFSQPKNHLRLISIFSEIVRRQPAARLLLIGRTAAGDDHAIEQRVRRRIVERGITDRVVLTGERTDVPRLLRAAEVLIFPSLWEGLGDVVLEACAAGTPVLASDLPSIREIAGRLPGVSCLSLDEPDAKWAQAAVEIAARPPSNLQRRAAWKSFADSVFTLPQCAATLCRIWDGDGGQ